MAGRRDPSHSLAGGTDVRGREQVNQKNNFSQSCPTKWDNMCLILQTNYQPISIKL